MKKFIALIMTALLVLAMAACGDNAPAQPYIPPVNSGSSGTTGATEGTTGVPGLQEQPVTEATQPRTETVPQVTEPEETEPQGVRAERYIESGEDDGYHYSNYSIELDFYAPDGLVFMDREELMAQNGMAAGAEWDDVNDKASTTPVFVMFAQDQTTGSSANVNVQRFTYEQVEQMDYKAVLESQIDTLVATYESMGFTDVECEYGLAEINGQEIDALSLTATISGQTFYAAVLSYGIDDLVVSVSVGSLDLDTANALLEGIEIG